MRKKNKENTTSNINKAFKLLKWLFIITAILSCVSIVFALMDQEVSVASYVMRCVDNIINSLMLAFIFGRTTVTGNKGRK